MKRKGLEYDLSSGYTHENGMAVAILYKNELSEWINNDSAHMLLNLPLTEKFKQNDGGTHSRLIQLDDPDYIDAHYSEEATQLMTETGAVFFQVPFDPALDYKKLNIFPTVKHLIIESAWPSLSKQESLWDVYKGFYALPRAYRLIFRDFMGVTDFYMRFIQEQVLFCHYCRKPVLKKDLLFRIFVLKDKPMSEENLMDNYLLNRRFNNTEPGSRPILVRKILDRLGTRFCCSNCSSDSYKKCYCFFMKRELDQFGFLLPLRLKYARLHEEPNSFKTMTDVNDFILKMFSENFTEIRSNNHLLKLYCCDETTSDMLAHKEMERLAKAWQMMEAIGSQLYKHEPKHQHPNVRLQLFSKK